MTSVLKKLALLTVSLGLSAGLAEVGARLLLVERFVLPHWETRDGVDVPFAESLHYLLHGTERSRFAREGGYGFLPPHMNIRQVYDRPKWDYFDEDGAIAVESNALGFRDLPFEVAKAPGELRVLALGDSFTYGLGVPLELTWTQQLERQLAAAHDGPVQVINGGWSGTSPADWVGWFETDGVLFRPDLVVVGLCLNDLSPKVPMLAYPAAEPEPWLGGVSELLNHVQREIEQRRLMREPRDYGALVREDDTFWQASQAALRQIAAVAAEHDARLAVVVLPMMSSLNDLYPYRGLHDMAAAFCADAQIPTLDLLPQFLGRPERELWVHPTDQHPNDVAHAMIATSIAKFVQESLL